MIRNREEFIQCLFAPSGSGRSCFSAASVVTKLFHLLVLIGVACHFLLIYGAVNGAAGI